MQLPTETRPIINVRLINPFHAPTLKQQISFYGYIIFICIPISIIDLAFSFTDVSCARQNVPVSIHYYLFIKALSEFLLHFICIFGTDFRIMQLRTTSIHPFTLFYIYFSKLKMLNYRVWVSSIIIGSFLYFWVIIIGSLTFWKWTDTSDCNEIIYTYLLISLCIKYILIVWQCVGLEGSGIREGELEIEKTNNDNDNYAEF
jgi:hypothetical protein